MSYYERIDKSSPRVVLGAMHGKIHADIARRRTAKHDLQISPMLSVAASQSRLRSEKAIEAAFLHYLTVRDQQTTSIFGEWDYVSHQVAASPFKPPDWMDKIDVFGASFIPGHAPVLSALLVAELKKDVAGSSFVEQTMKYVDWVKDEYAHLDYSLIRAYLVASDFDASALSQHKEYAVRRYTVGRRPPRSEKVGGVDLSPIHVQPLFRTPGLSSGGSGGSKLVRQAVS